jgi:hypothetical protein
MRTPDPEHDGKFFINMYSKALTSLGRKLSHFTFRPFTHPEFGNFNSLEGFWYWLSTGMQHESLRAQYGFNAKANGRKLQRVSHPNFEKEFRKAALISIMSDPELAHAMMRSNLPFEHFYVSEAGSVTKDHRFDWLIEMYESIRTELKYIL